MEKQETISDTPFKPENSDKVSICSSNSNCNDDSNHEGSNLDGSNNSNGDNNASFDSQILENQSDNNFKQYQGSSINDQDRLLTKNNSSVFDQNQLKLLKQKDKLLIKKPWYSAFTYTYKQRNEDFKKLFKDLPADERLLVDYACALQKEILAQGRLYISLNYVCFYANILGWETALTIKLKDIKLIQKDKTVKVIPNAITLVLDNDKHFFTSFAYRDKTYTTLYKMWQTAMLEQSIDNDEVNTLLRSFYGEDLGYNSDDEEYEYYMKTKLTKNSANNSAEPNFLSFENQGFYINSDIVSSPKMENYNDNVSLVELETSASLPNFHIGLTSSTDCISTASNSNKNSPTRINDTNSSNELKKSSAINDFENVNQIGSNIDLSIQNKLEILEKSKQNTEIDYNIPDKLDDNAISSLRSSPSLKYRKIRGNSRKKISSESSSDDESECLPIKCDCIEHVGKEMLNKTYNLSVNYLFECMFGHTEFCLKFWESRKFFDMKIGEWENAESCKTRRLEYLVALNSPVAVKQCKNTEDQKLIKYIPNKCIIMESISVSHGVPYADYFAVACRYCITKVDKKRSNFKVHAYIKYSQKPMFVVKAFIEKNAMGALADAYQYLANYISQEFVINGISCHDVKNSFLNRFNDDLNDNKQLKTKETNIKSLNKNERKFSEQVESKSDFVTEISAIKVTKFSKACNNENGDHKLLKKTKMKNNVNAIPNDITNNRKRNQNAQQIDLSAKNYSNSIQSNINNTPQLVPIQTFSFLKWSINVDTLVRLFIIAMVCLMIINGMLYLKLRRIETLADGLKNDPQIISKYHKLLNENPIENSMFLNKDVSNMDYNNWKEILIETLKNIEKMGYSVKEWNQNYENNDLNSGNELNKDL